MTSVKHKNLILRIAHGDVYTKEKLFRYGLADSPNCPRCDEIETLEHKIVGCQYAKRICGEVLRITNSLRINPLNPIETNIETALGTQEPNHVILTVQAETLSRLFMLKDTQEYLIRPKLFVELAIKYLIRVESNRETKRILKSLLDPVD